MLKPWFYSWLPLTDCAILRTLFVCSTPFISLFSPSFLGKLILQPRVSILIYPSTRICGARFLLFVVHFDIRIQKAFSEWMFQVLTVTFFMFSASGGLPLKTEVKHEFKGCFPCLARNDTGKVIKMLWPKSTLIHWFLCRTSHADLLSKQP